MKTRWYVVTVVSSGTYLTGQGLPRKGAPPSFPRAQRGLPTKRKIPNVSKIVAVSSAKGGVGKSTIAGPITSIAHRVLLSPDTKVLSQ
jgi:Mrp family chromosome partitioning ATPase